MLLLLIAKVCVWSLPYLRRRERKTRRRGILYETDDTDYRQTRHVMFRKRTKIVDSGWKMDEEEDKFEERIGERERDDSDRTGEETLSVSNDHEFLLVSKQRMETFSGN